MAKTILTCAVTGGLTKPEMTPYLPITPNQIADSCLGAADAGAAAVHIHVRDPISGSQSMDFDLYAKVVELIRMQNKELIINLTTGPGGRFIPSEDDPKVFAPGTTLCHPLKRVGVLEFVEQQVPVACVEPGMHAGGMVVVGQQAAGLLLEVGEIDAVIL